MIFIETELEGAFVIQPQRLEDERGFFARTWCQREFGEHGLGTKWVQCNISFNKTEGTLRGMHYQVAPYKEAKLLRCTMGAIYDVIIDLRPESSTFMQHFAVVLTAQNRTMLYVPEGFAHGFLTQEDDTEVFYQMSEFYVTECARGLRWDDPQLGIQWQGDVRVISDRDRNHPDFNVNDFVRESSRP
jgi:dTDP-4-dehydrorhamnose 3,5-epimerase